MCLGGSVSHNRFRSRSYSQPADLGHYVERNQEVEKHPTYFCSPADRLFLLIAGHRDGIRVETVEDFKIFLEARADISVYNRFVLAII
jgi:hypothetical protein